MRDMDQNSGTCMENDAPPQTSTAPVSEENPHAHAQAGEAEDRGSGMRDEGAGLKAPRRFVGRRRAAERKEGGEGSEALVRGGAGGKARVLYNIPDSITQNAELNADIALLPPNYNFEVHKTVWRLREAGCKIVALQLPEGLQMFACTLADIISKHANCEAVILGDVTYGACCVDDLNARALGADFLVHYGHSCLVPIDTCTVKTLYIFVDISIDVGHLVATLRHNFPETHKLLLVSTVQFVGSVHKAKEELSKNFASVTLPQSRPLSKGEVLGCTAPTIEPGSANAVVYVGDGRFHLEAIMIANPDLEAYRYDPYSKIFSKEGYAHGQLYENRQKAISVAKGARTFGIILGTLGRQGNPNILDRLIQLVTNAGCSHIVVLLSEISPKKLALFEDVDAWIQVACPRLSIDWGHAFKRPLLTSYEAEVALKVTEWRPIYPMDYYSQSAGPWANYPRNNEVKAAAQAAAAAAIAIASNM